MLMLISFPSFFSSFARQRDRLRITALSAYERNEKYEKRRSTATGIFCSSSDLL